MQTADQEWARLTRRIGVCDACPRLRAWSETAPGHSRRHVGADYWGRPVAGFGDPEARLLVVGLAPGRHGANRTGRPFTGDAAGAWLYRALYAEGFSNRAESRERGDGLVLTDVYITNIVRCAPPGDRPAAEEILRCRPYLEQERALLTRLKGVLVLGRTAFAHVCGPDRRPRPVFSHGRVYTESDGKPWVLASYHPSQRNTRTGRLTAAMWSDVWAIVRDRLDADGKVGR